MSKIKLENKKKFYKIYGIILFLVTIVVLFWFLGSVEKSEFHASKITLTFSMVLSSLLIASFYFLNKGFGDEDSD